MVEEVNELELGLHVAPASGVVEYPAGNLFAAASRVGAS